MTSIIALEAMTKRYGTRGTHTTAIDEQPLAIGPGELASLKGPSVGREP
jgi:ABC-type multidrug transport system ATPase subunit